MTDFMNYWFRGFEKGLSGLSEQERNCLLGECSRRSLLYNLESVFPEKKIEVLLLESILRGGDECILRISIE